MNQYLHHKEDVQLYHKAITFTFTPQSPNQSNQRIDGVLLDYLELRMIKKVIRMAKIIMTHPMVNMVNIVNHNRLI